ncbi:MAG: hypothetical protein IV100_23935 [Myxococcales bacterium]|nr:hypothetical protein [Myxococcales bacterium]
MTGAQGLWVSALSTRDLRDPASVVVTAATTPDGRFELPIPPTHEGPVWLLASAACDPRLLACRRFLPRVDAVLPGAHDVRLEIPDLAVAEAVWRGEPVGTQTGRWAGTGIIVMLLVFGARLRRHPASPSAAADSRAPWSWLLAAAGLTALVSSFGLGAESLDLLEYTYFHEALRPASAWALLTDPMSAELAHGPLMPLVLRGIGAFTVDPFWLRLPSALFAGAFVAVMGLVSHRALASTSPAAARAGLAAVLVLSALHPVCAYYGRDASPYALAGLLAALALLLAPGVTRGRVGGLRWPLFAVVHLAGFLSHYGFAFFSAAQGLALLVTALRVPALRRDSGAAAWAFAAAAALPVAFAPHYEHMLTASGLRFGLMAGAYPESPGLLAFVGRMAAVLAGLPAHAVWALVLVFPIVALGLRALRAHCPSLAAQAGMLILFVAAWLLFSHTMSVAFGGGRIYWAFRWARPLLAGLLVVLAASAVTRKGATSGPGLAGVVLLAGSWTWQSAVSVAPPVRPDQDAAVTHLQRHASDGDAYLVMPASFYGDQLQYYVDRGQPPALITAMRAHETELGAPAAPRRLRGPLVELGLPAETVVDRLEYTSVWIVDYREVMFGTPKFSPVPTDQLLTELTRRGWTHDEHVALPFLDLHRVRCSADCAWEGQRRLMLDLGDGVRAERFLARRPGEEGLPFLLPVTLVLPEDTASVTVRPKRPGLPAAQLTLAGTAESVPRLTLPLAPGRRYRVHLEADGASESDYVLELVRR